MLPDVAQERVLQQQVSAALTRARRRTWVRATIRPFVKHRGRAHPPKRMKRTPERIGKYKIIREIGRGATAVVYLAESEDYPEPVALKHVRFDDKVKDEAKWNRRVIKLL